MHQWKGRGGQSMNRKAELGNASIEKHGGLSMKERQRWAMYEWKNKGVNVCIEKHGKSMNRKAQLGNASVETQMWKIYA